MNTRYISNLIHKLCSRRVLLGAASVPLIFGGVVMDASATAPCGDFGECKALIEINASDGDIGFHFLMDGDDLKWAWIRDPNHRMIFFDKAKGALRKQRLTETFAESAEPPCWYEEGNEDVDWEEDEVVTLEEFLDRWTPGTYTYRGKGDPGEWSTGETELTYHLPAAPAEVEFYGSVISWEPGDDLGECADYDNLADLVSDGVLPKHPEDVEVVVWEAVFEADDGSDLKFSVRVPASQTEVTVPADYLASLPPDTPAKIEVGAIGVDSNATFTEEDGICINENKGCEE